MALAPVAAEGEPGSHRARAGPTAGRRGPARPRPPGPRRPLRPRRGPGLLHRAQPHRQALPGAAFVRAGRGDDDRGDAGLPPRVAPRGPSARSHARSGPGRRSGEVRQGRGAARRRRTTPGRGAHRWWNSSRSASARSRRTPRGRRPDGAPRPPLRRPAWLLALLVPALLVFLVRRREAGAGAVLYPGAGAPGPAGRGPPCAAAALAPRRGPPGPGAGRSRPRAAAEGVHQGDRDHAGRRHRGGPRRLGLHGRRGLPAAQPARGRAQGGGRLRGAAPPRPHRARGLRRPEPHQGPAHHRRGGAPEAARRRQARHAARRHGHRLRPRHLSHPLAPLARPRARWSCS